MQIPFVDLKAQYQRLKRGIDSAINKVIDEAAFIKGKYVESFESEYATSYGVKHCISCANGTDAIYITLKALGIGPGDEVITVANSWISTSEAITQTGAKPVFVDVHPIYYTINVELIDNKISANTKAILPVHLYGQPAQMDKLKELCDAYNLFLVEDCAQAHFAKFKKQNVGTFGIAGTFSFFPSKNLGAYGDAGAIITNDDAFANKARMFANHGMLKRHQHEFEGINSRLDGLQAAILSVKLPHILDWNEARLNNALLYNRLLSGNNHIAVPKIHYDVTHVFHVYVIRTDHRNELSKYLKDKGIATGVHYPTALPFLKAYSYLGHHPKDFPVAYEYQEKILSLPMYPELTGEMIETVVAEINGYFSNYIN